MFTLHNGDCLQVMPTIPSGSIDMILCDLPYGQINSHWDKALPISELWKEYQRVIKKSGAILLFGIEPFSSMLRMSNINNYKHEWYWNKEVSGNFIQAKNHPMKVIENVLCFSFGKVNYYPIIENAKPENIRPQKESRQKSDFLGTVSNGVFIPKSDKNKRYPKNLITYNARKGECNNVNRIHPTQKPVELLQYLICTYTKEGETVLDNTMGSGSTIEAAERTGRNSIGIEKDEGIFQTAVLRLKSLTPSNTACSGLAGTARLESEVSQPANR